MLELTNYQLFYTVMTIMPISAVLNTIDSSLEQTVITEVRSEVNMNLAAALYVTLAELFDETI